MTASIKVTLYRDEGVAPSINIIAPNEAEANGVEWLTLVGLARHYARQPGISAAQRAAANFLIGVSTESSERPSNLCVGCFGCDLCAQPMMPDPEEDPEEDR